jgi:hypothetical protein
MDEDEQGSPSCSDEECDRCGSAMCLHVGSRGARDGTLVESGVPDLVGSGDEKDRQRGLMELVGSGLTLAVEQERAQRRHWGERPEEPSLEEVDAEQVLAVELALQVVLEQALEVELVLQVVLERRPPAEERSHLR